MAYVSDMCDVNLHFFGSDKADGRRSFAREAVTQWAAASDLVFDFGWPQENLLVESSDQWALDLVAYDRPRREGGRRTLLAMEAKSHRRELEGLIDEMKRCRGLDPSQHRKWPTLKSPHRKCEGLLRLRYGLPKPTRLLNGLFAPCATESWISRSCSVNDTSIGSFGVTRSTTTPGGPTEASTFAPRTEHRSGRSHPRCRVFAGSMSSVG